MTALDPSALLASEAGRAAVEAGAEATFEVEYPAWSPDAHPDSNRWSWRGEGHNDETRSWYRGGARATLAAALPLLLPEIERAVREKVAGVLPDAIAAVRWAKEQAIEMDDFVRLAGLRDVEKRLSAALSAVRP